jgi:ATP-dependent DNA helicase RecG
MIDLHDIKRYQENNRIEAKLAAGGLPHSMWDTYSAFANTIGGLILLGVEESRKKELTIRGLTDPERYVSEMWEILNDRSRISENILQPDQIMIQEVEGKRIILLEVPRADRHQRPVYIGTDPFSGSYRRNGEGDYHCSEEEVRGMLRDKGDVPLDRRVISSMRCSALCPDTICAYRKRLQALYPGHALNQMEEREFLQKLGAGFPDGDGVLHPTAAGLLLFGWKRQIVKEFPNYVLDYREYLDEKKDRWNFRIVSSSDDWSGNLFDFYFAVYDRICHGMDACVSLEVGEERISLALQEALTNAILHADYHDRHGLVIKKYRDRVVVSNPGCLRINPAAAVCDGVSDPRNALLIQMFWLVGVGKRSGSGLRRIRGIWSQSGFVPPKLLEDFNPPRTTLILDFQKISERRAEEQEQEEKQKILDYLMEQVEAGCTELSGATGIKPSSVRSYLEELEAAGLVTAKGDSQNRPYRLRA